MLQVTQFNRQCPNERHWVRKCACNLAACVIIGAAVTEARGEAQFSLQGQFDLASDQQDVVIQIGFEVASPDPLEFRTWSHTGTGVSGNHAGDIIPGGGFNPTLELLRSATRAAFTDDGTGSAGNFDAVLNFTAAPTGSSARAVPDPLPAGDYTVRVQVHEDNFNGLSKDWALDLSGPDGALVLTLDIIDQIPGAPGLSMVSVIGSGSKAINTTSFVVGLHGVGTLTVADGGHISAVSSAVGHSAGSTGAATVTGAGSHWENSGGLAIGNFGNSGAMLTVSEGGVVSSGNGNLADGVGGIGSTTITGANSRWDIGGILRVGGLGDGTMVVSDGGVVSNTLGTVADQTTSNSIMTVSGAGSTWNSTDRLTIGNGGAGTLRIENGGLVTNAVESRIGNTTTGTGAVTVTGAGSKWENSGNLFVGFFGSAEVRIEAGGVVSNATSHVGSTAFGSVGDGQVTVSGLESKWISTGELSVGTLGDVAVSDGGLVTVGGSRSANEGVITNNLGVINFDNGFANLSTGQIGGRGEFKAAGGWTNEGLIDFTGTADVHGDVVNEPGGQIVSDGGGVTRFHNSLTHNGAEIRTAASSQTVFLGAVAGDGNYTGAGTVIFESELRPGNSPGLISVEGDAVLGGASITIIELGGLTRGDDYDAIDIGTSLTLGGDLVVDYVEIFEASTGNVFDLFYSPTIVGTFATVALPDLDATQFWSLETVIDFSGDTDVLRLSVVSSIPLPPAVWFFISALFIGYSYFRRAREYC